MTSGWAKRQQVWRHNSHRGHARMMMAQCTAIISSETATPEAKDLARDIYAKAADLSAELRNRKDPA